MLKPTYINIQLPLESLYISNGTCRDFVNCDDLKVFLDNQLDWDRVSNFRWIVQAPTIVFGYL